MSAKKTSKPPKLSVNDASNAEQRAQVEAQISSAVEARQAPHSESTALVPAVQQVEIQNSRGKGKRTAFVDAKNRFISKSAARAIVSVQTTQNSLETKDPETGKSQQQLLEEKLIQMIKDAPIEQLVGASKAFETLMSRAHGKVRNSPLEQAESKPGLTVIFDHPNLGPAIDWKDSPLNSENQLTKPSWIEAEVVSTNPSGEPKDKVEGQ